MNLNQQDTMSNKRIIRCAVAAHNSNGEPDLFFVKVEATDEQIENGKHYEAATDAANEEGYAASNIVFDEECAAGRALLPLFQWETASIVTCLSQCRVGKNALPKTVNEQMRDALEWISAFAYEHPEWEAEQFPIDTPEGDWLACVRGLIDPAMQAASNLTPAALIEAAKEGKELDGD